VGNTTVTGFINVSSYGTFGGTVNAASLNVSGVTGSGNTTVTGFINASSYGTFGGAVNATALNIGSNVVINDTSVSVGNSTVNTSMTATTFGGNATFTVGNTTINGVATITGNTVAAQINATSINVSNDLTVGGNLTVSGSLTTVNTVNLNITDPLIALANGNATADISDIGFFGRHGNNTVTQYTGLFRKFSTSTYQLFDGLTVAPTTTVDTANASYTYATLKSFISTGGSGADGLIANATHVAITANGSMSVGITANTLSLSTALSGTSGGTGLASYTSQDLLVANSSNGFSKLGIGTEGYVLQVIGGSLSYSSLDGGAF
jgi:hypothetical protein